MKPQRAAHDVRELVELIALGFMVGALAMLIIPNL
jgi:hypothetical protein